MVARESNVLDTFHGDESFPIEWAAGEAELFWVLDDLHCPNPLSPLFFDLGGWWLTCDHMFRRFGTPFACDWVAKNVNGYLYTAAIPADPTVACRGERVPGAATRRVCRMIPRTRRKIGAYLGFVLPHYAANFLDWWRDRLRPEIERNFAYLDGYDTDDASLVELAVLLEDAIDIHDRHWKIHWMLNFAQFSATMALNGTIEQVKGEVDPALVGPPAELRGGPQLGLDRGALADEGGDQGRRRAAAPPSRARRRPTSLRALEALRARPPVRPRAPEPYRQEFGYKAIWSHEFSFPTWRENPAPIVEAVRGYLETDYDYPAAIQAVRDDLEAARRSSSSGVPDGRGARSASRQALELSLRMNPLTPDHHFYIDQGTNARVRLAAIAIGRKLVEAGALDDPEDVVYLRYNELRLLSGEPGGVRRADARLRAARRAGAAGADPAARSGSAPRPRRPSPSRTWSLWGFPEKFYRPPPDKVDEVHGLGASPGVVEGVARSVASLDEFDQVQEGEILVCQMTNPAWVVLFTKIAGLVTDAGGVAAHPAVVAREFGIPAVVGTSIATERIKSGDRVRVNGTSGVVEVLR